MFKQLLSHLPSSDKVIIVVTIGSVLCGFFALVKAYIKRGKEKSLNTKRLEIYPLVIEYVKLLVEWRQYLGNFGKDDREKQLKDSLVAKESEYLNKFQIIAPKKVLKKYESLKREIVVKNMSVENAHNSICAILK
jgi:hypothetical protein